MNCQICEKEFEAYIQSTLSAELRIQVEKHLEECESCSDNLFLERLAASYVQDERAILPDDALAQKIMEQLESGDLNRRRRVIHTTFWRNFVYATSVAAAIFAGVMAGNFYLPASDNPVPAEMSYMDDEQMEAVNLFVDEN